MKNINLLERVQNRVWNVALALKQAIKMGTGEFILSSSTGSIQRTVTQCPMVSAQIFNRKAQSCHCNMYYKHLTGQVGSVAQQWHLASLSESKDCMGSSLKSRHLGPESRFYKHIPMETNRSKQLCAHLLFHILHYYYCLTHSEIRHPLPSDMHSILSEVKLYLLLPIRETVPRSGRLSCC